MKLEITHFIPGPPEPQRYVPLVCYCKVMGKNYYIEGMDESAVFEREEIDALERSGDIIKLSRPYEKTKQNCLFVIPSGQVVLASKDNPREDKSRTVIARIHMKQLPSLGITVSLDKLKGELAFLSPQEKVDTICKFLLRVETNKETIAVVKAMLQEMVS
jgi:hypothetical protein